MSQNKLLHYLDYFFSFELSRFVVVGGFAASVHFLFVILLVQSLQFSPLVANAFAFFIAFQVSYFGHYFFTFSETIAYHSVAYFKLVFMQTILFIINETLFYLLLSFKFIYPVALFMVLLIMSFLSFILSKRWVFA